MAAMKLMPADSCNESKVRRASAVSGSSPTVEISTPRAAAKTPLAIESPVSPPTSNKPITASSR